MSDCLFPDPSPEECSQEERELESNGLTIEWTRRQFMQTAGVLSAGVAVGFPALANAEPAPLAMMRTATLNVNGKSQTLSLDPRTSLLDALRENMGLTGSKKGCDHGQCGACTVLLDGRRVNSCLTLALAAEGAAITTIEGLAKSSDPQDLGDLHPMQAAFLEHDG